MNCDRVRLLLNAYVDGELDLLASLDVEDHLRGCAACTQQRQALLSLHSAASDKSLYYHAPAALEKRIRPSLSKANPASRRSSLFSRQRWLAPAAAALVIVLLIAAFLLPSLWANSQDSLLAEEVQTAHVRSLMADHLIDVVSSDQHTVKPWFNGELDFSPPVSDLAAQGFPLDGGRLDYLGGQPVAALIYQRNKHYINLFIWPSASQSPGLKSSTNNGYHLFHWNQSGMAFWAISDLNADELQVFIAAFQKSAQTAP